MVKGLASLNEAMIQAIQGRPTWMGYSEIFDKMWSMGEVNGNPLQYYCLESPMDSTKRQKIYVIEDINMKKTWSFHEVSYVLI